MTSSLIFFTLSYLMKRQNTSQRTKQYSKEDILDFKIHLGHKEEWGDALILCFYFSPLFFTVEVSNCIFYFIKMILKVFSFLSIESISQN